MRIVRYLRYIKLIPRPLNAESIVHTTQEIEDSLGAMARGLKASFSTCINSPLMRQDTLENTEDISLSVLSSVEARLPAAAPGPDDITMKMLNVLGCCSKCVNGYCKLFYKTLLDSFSVEGS